MANTKKVKITMPPIPAREFTVDDMLDMALAAKKRLGGDKLLILSLSGSEIENAHVNSMVIMDEGDDRYVEVRCEHPSLVIRDAVPESERPGGRVQMASVADTMAHFNLSDSEWERIAPVVQEKFRRYVRHARLT